MLDAPRVPSIPPAMLPYHVKGPHSQPPAPSPALVQHLRYGPFRGPPHFRHPSQQVPGYEYPRERGAASQRCYPGGARQQYPAREPKPHPTPQPRAPTRQEEIRVYMGSEASNEDIASSEVMVVAGGKRFIEDRVMLSNASPIFERLLSPDAKGNVRDKVIVDGVGAERMKLVLDYMRRRRMKICCPDTALAMLEPAQRFLLDSLTDSIEKYLLQNVPPEHYCELYRYSDERGLGVLKGKFMQRIASDMARFARGQDFLRLEIRLVECLVHKAVRAGGRNPEHRAEVQLAVVEAITRWLLAGRRNRVGDKLLSGFSRRTSGVGMGGDDVVARRHSMGRYGNVHDMRRDDGATPWRGLHGGRGAPWLGEMWNAEDEDEDGSVLASEDGHSRYGPDGDMDSVIGSDGSHAQSQSQSRRGGNMAWRFGGARGVGEGGSDYLERRSGRSEGQWGGAGMAWRGGRIENERQWGDDDGMSSRGSGRGSSHGMGRPPLHRRGHMAPWGGGDRPEDEDSDDYGSEDRGENLGWLREGFSRMTGGRMGEGDIDSMLGSEDSFEQPRRGMGGWGGSSGGAPWRDRSSDGGSVHSGRSRRSGGMGMGAGGGWGVGGVGGGMRMDRGDNFGDDRSSYGGSRRGSGSVRSGSRYGRDDDSESESSSDSDGEDRIVQTKSWKGAGGECGNCLLRGRHDFHTGSMKLEELVDENRTHYEERLFRVVNLDELDDDDLDRVRDLADANGLAFLHDLTERVDKKREDEMLGAPPAVVGAMRPMH